MVKYFQIVDTKVHHNRGVFIVAKHLGADHDFKVGDGAILGDLPVYHYSEIQPKAHHDDKPLEDIFVFRPVDIDRLFDRSLKQGDIVTLTLSR
jgi:hypothetical protein